MQENRLLDLSYEFAVAIVNLVDNIKVPKSSYMTDQLARSGTLEIALKETSETSYWLKLMYDTKRIDELTYCKTEKLCGNIRRLLIASCKTAKENPLYER